MKPKAPTKAKTTTESAPRESREFMAQRILKSYIERLDALAAKTDRPARQILEYALERALPQLEQEAGIAPPKSP